MAVTVEDVIVMIFLLMVLHPVHCFAEIYNQ
jgi:hypothetical protein